MKKQQFLCAVATLVMLALAAPASAVEALEGEKPRHKVKNIRELDENAPKDAGGKIQFIPTAKAAKQLRAEKRRERLAAKAEKRQKKAEERTRLRGLRQGAHGAKQTAKAHAHKAKAHKVKVHKVKVHKTKVHKVKVKKLKVKKARHPGRKHKKR